jgi:oligosaccharide repeat unit polymerase
MNVPRITGQGTGNVQPAYRWAQIELVAATAAATMALLTLGAESVATNRAVIFICATLWIVMCVVAVSEIVVSGAQLTKATCLLGVTYWFWIEAIDLALDNPPFVVAPTFYPYLSGEYPSSLVATGVTAVSLFGLCLLAGYHMVRPVAIVQRALVQRQDAVSGIWLDGICFGLSILGWIPVLITVGADLEWLLEIMSSMRSYQLTGQESDVGLAVHFGLVSVAGGALALARLAAGIQGSRVFQVLAFLSAMILVFSTGSRFNLGYLMLPTVMSLAALLQHSGAKAVRGARPKVIVAVLIVSCAAILQGALRGMGLVEGRSYLDEQSVVSIGQAGGFGHEHFSAALLAIDLTQRRGEYYMEPMTPYFFTHFIPKDVWPDKPYPKSWLEYNSVVTGGTETFNVTPSVVGQYYMNWGLLGVMYIGLFFGALARTLDGCLAILDPEIQFIALVICGMWAVFLFLSFRFFYPLYFAFPVAGTVIYLVLSTTHRRKRSLKLGR